MPLLTVDSPPGLAHLIEKLAFDDKTGDFAIVFKRPMRIHNIKGEGDLSLLGAEFPVGRLLKVFVKPMDQAPTDKKLVTLS